MPCSRSITSGGTTSAATASPDSTFAIASAREETRIGSTRLNSSEAYCVASRRWPPSWICAPPRGTRLANATFGFAGPEDSAAPTSRATSSG